MLMLTTLRYRNFALVWFAGLISYIGDWMLVTALGFYVYDLTKVVLSTGLLFIAYIVPTLVFGSVAGVVADLRDRKWLMITANALRAPLLLALLIVNTPEQVWIVYVVVFIESSISIFFTSAENALLPNLVDEQNLMAANGMNSLNDNISRLIGPVFGGAVLASFGMHSVVISDVISYAIAGVLIAFIAAPTSAAPATAPIAQPALLERWSSFWHEWLEGLRLVKRERIVSALFVITAVTEVASSMVNVLIVAFVLNLLKGSALEFGWMMAARGIGGLLGGALIAQLGSKLSPTRLIPICLGGMGIAFLVIFNNPILYLALALILIVGVLSVGKSVSDRMLLQNNVANEYRGRIFGFYYMTIAFVSLGGTGLSGLFGDRVGVLPMLDLAGALFIGAGILGLFLLSRVTIVGFPPQVEQKSGQ
jgi:MFS family permease